MPLEAGTQVNVGIRPVERPQSAGGPDRVGQRTGGSSSEAFAPRTNVALQAAVDDMAGILAKVASTHSEAVEKMPQELQEVIKNVLKQAFAFEETLGQGLGSTVESQRFTAEQLTSMSRMLNQMAALAEKGTTSAASDTLQVLLTNLKAMVSSSSADSKVLEPVLLLKASFEMLVDKNFDDLPQELQQLLLSLQPKGQPSIMPFEEGSSLNFLKQLVQFFMPRPAAAEGGQPQPQGAPQEQQAQQGQQGQNAPQGQTAQQSQASTQGQTAQQGQMMQQGQTAQQGANAPQGQMQSTQQGEAQASQGQNQAQQPGQAGQGQNLQQGQNSAQGQQGAGQSQNAPQGQQANAQGQNAPQGQQTAVQGQPAPQGQQAAQQGQGAPQSGQPQAAPEGQQTAQQGQNAQGQQGAQGQPQAGQGQNLQQGQQAAQGQQQGSPQGQSANASQGQNPSAGAQQGQGAFQGQNAQGQPQGTQQPLQQEPFFQQQMRMRPQQGQLTQPNAPQQEAMQQAKAQLMSQTMENTPQTMETMKNLAQMLLKNAQLTQRDAQLLQNFVNGRQTGLGEQEAKQLQQLIRLCQQNVPVTVQQAALQQKIPDLPRLYAFMQLCDMANTRQMNAKQLKHASRDVAAFVLAMRGSMSGENSMVQGQRALSFMMPMYLGENEQSYPSYIHVYDEARQDPETGYLKKETWLRLCVLTENIGAVELTCRVFDENQLDMRLFFSDSAIADEFRASMQDIRQALRGSENLKLNELKVGAVGERRFI